MRVLRRGIPVAIGTDGPASNNCLDFFREMFLVTALQKVREDDAAACDALEVLRMACVNGAHAMRLPDCDGLEPGKQADLVLLDLHQPNMQPENHILKNVVYSGSKQNVRLTMVAGKILYEDGVFYTGCDPERIYAEANAIIRRMTVPFLSSPAFFLERKAGRESRKRTGISFFSPPRFLCNLVFLFSILILSVERKGGKRKSRRSGFFSCSSPAPLRLGFPFFRSFLSVERKRTQKKVTNGPIKLRHIRQGSLCYTGFATFSLLLFFFQKKKSREKNRKTSATHADSHKTSKQ